MATLGGGRRLSEPEPILRVPKISKTFPGTQALAGVDFEVRQGEVHALVGHNGSGKTTLVKVLSGYHHVDSGSASHCWLETDRVPLSDLAARHPKRIRFVHQELGLVLELSAVENLALRAGFFRGRLGRVRWGEQIEIARRLVEPFGIAVDLQAPLSSATPVERTIIAIALALRGWNPDGGILVLDEPTAVLAPAEVSQLFRVVKQFRDSGAGVIYVSHRLHEIFELADRVTVLRNGRRVDTLPVDQLSKNHLVHLMLGAETDSDYHADIPAPKESESVLDVKDLAGSFLSPVSFSLRPGEILGIAGLPRCGRDELPRLLADQRKRAAGKATAGPRARRNGQIALLPPDRGSEGIFGPMSVGENLTLSVLGKFRRRLGLSRKREASFTNHLLRELTVMPPEPSAAIGTLSGGNQQKVLLGRCLVTDPDVLVLCEPTAGVDIGARFAIYDLIAERVRAGLSVIVTTSDPGDLLALCTRVLVLDEHGIARELTGSNLSERNLAHAMEGWKSHPHEGIHAIQ